MKKNIIKSMAGAMAVTMILSGCNSAQLKIGSDDEEATEESGVADSENESDEEASDDSGASASKESDEDSSADISNEYFYKDAQDEYVYSVEEFLYEEITEVPVKVELLESYDGGNVYSLNIDYDEDCQGRYYYETTDRFYLGTLYVTSDRIYMIKDSESVPSKEDFEDHGIEICSALDSETDKNGDVVSIENDGDVCTCTMYNSQTESGFYESFEWTKGKGLTHYRSGYGAEGDPIELYLKDADDENDSAKEEYESASAKEDSESASAKEDTESAFDDITDYDSTEMLDGEELTEDELASIQEFLNQRENNGFAVAAYKTPDKVDWLEVFYSGAGIKNCDYPDEALDAYLDAIGEESVEYDLIALSGDDVRSYIETKTGITDFDVSLIRGFTYVEEYDILFSEVSDSISVNVVCEKGIRRDNLIQVIFYCDGVMYYDLSRYRRISLIETGDSDNPYQFYSNRELWEDSAESIVAGSVYGTDEKILCGVTSGGNGPYISVIKDNAVDRILFPRLQDIDLSEYKDVKEITFCDVDDDDLQDIVIILSDGNDTVAVVCAGYETYGGYVENSQGSDAVTKWLSKNVKNLTADNVIKYIQKHKDEYNEL